MFCPGLGSLPLLVACAAAPRATAPSTAGPAAVASPELARGSPCTPVDEPYVGTLCTPDPGNSGRHGAIVFFGGYGGDIEAKRLALEFAQRGYVTAAVSYFGAPRTPRTLVDVPVEIGVAAVAALAARADVDPARLAVMGSSKGGEYALLVASSSPAVKAVIANVPSPFAWYGLGRQGVPTGCSWSRGGRSLPCVPMSVQADQAWEQRDERRPISFRSGYEAARRDTTAVARAFFPLEKIAGPVVCLAAGDDQVWNSAAQCALAMDYLRAHHHPFADRARTFEGAGHVYLNARSGPARR